MKNNQLKKSHRKNLFSKKSIKKFIINSFVFTMIFAIVLSLLLPSFF